MIVDILTKFNYRRKIYLTPEHPFCSYDDGFKMQYSSAVIMQAGLNKKVKLLNNFELERLMKYGLKMNSSDIAWALRNSKEYEMICEFVLENIKTGKEKIIFLMDLLNVSGIGSEISADEIKFLKKFADKLGISEQIFEVVRRFIECAVKEESKECFELSQIIKNLYPEIELIDMKYFALQIYEYSECTQRILEEKRELRITDRCQIYEDIVLRRGMKLVFYHALVRVYGNILLDGGTLEILNSKVIRKSDSHRSCINLKGDYSNVVIKGCEADCRNYGMFIRAESGKVVVSESNIYNTTRGAAIRFWGESIEITNCIFSRCYSPEDGGAVMVRGGVGKISKCRFADCEAKRGGAVYIVENICLDKCHFTNCNVAEYGAAVFCSGLADIDDRELEYVACHPEGAEFVQVLKKNGELRILGDMLINKSTIVDCPVYVESSGNLSVSKAALYLNYPVMCAGNLKLVHARIVANHLENSDMLYLEGARKCEISNCEFDGALRTGGINIKGTNVTIKNSLFRNTYGGRAVFNAYRPVIKESIFNFCQDGAIYTQGGEIEKCVFVNCRAKSGAGISMYGNKGLVKHCNFKRCIAKKGGGAIDRQVGTHIEKCQFEECKPADIS